MAFPVVQARNTSQNSTAATSHTVNLPAGIVSGDLLIVHFTFAITGQTNPLGWPAGWTQFYFAEQTGGASDGAAGAYRQADGSEGATITVTTSASTKSAHVSLRITGHENPATQAPESATAIGSNANANPPSLTATGGPKDILWLALGANSHPTVYTAPPTNYSNLQTIGTTGGAVGTNTVAGSGERQLNASVEDPGAFTGADAASEWVGVTVAVHPASTTARRAQVSWAELEVPTAPRRAFVSWVEFEVPTAPRRALVSWVEFEVPTAPRRAQVSWTEFEVPTTNRRALVSWVEFEVPTAPRRALVSWSELEVPLSPRRARVSWVEFEVPSVGGGGDSDEDEEEWLDNVINYLFRRVQ